MTSIRAPLCMTCKWFILEVGNWHCKAFPDGIPLDILHGDFDHHYPHDGDHGIQYEPL